MNRLQVTKIIREIQNRKLSIGVAIEGGGLRGLVSAAMLDFLRAHGFDSQVRALSGTSAGAINGTYFLCNQMADLFELYKKMASSHFIQPLQFPDAMNLDYLFEQQIPVHHPIHIPENPIKYYVTLTNTSTGQSEAHSMQSIRTQKELLSHLRASCSAPLYCTNQEEIDGQFWNDGHVGLPIPYEPLLTEDVDYILCLMTQKRGYKKSRRFINRVHEYISLRNFPKAYKKQFSASYEIYNRQLDFIFNHPKLIPLQIQSDDFIISKMCTDPTQVDRCRESVYKRMESLLTS